MSFIIKIIFSGLHGCRPLLNKRELQMWPSLFIHTSERRSSIVKWAQVHGVKEKKIVRERERKTVALILLAWVKKRDTVKWKNSSFLSAPQLTSWTGYTNGFNLGCSDLHNRQMNSSDWIGLDGGKKNPSELGYDGNWKGYFIYFSHWNNYRINLPFQCDSPLSPLCQSEFDVLDSLWKLFDSFGE